MTSSRAIHNDAHRFTRTAREHTRHPVHHTDTAGVMSPASALAAKPMGQVRVEAS